jgi:hypothetical protein
MGKEAKMAESERWYVLTVRSGFAPFVAAELHRQGVQVFLPDIKAEPAAPGRISHPDLVFARLALKDQRSVVTLPGFLCIAGVPEPVPVGEEEISNLQAAAWIGLAMMAPTETPHPQPGRILDGPLEGLTGKFLNQNGTWHLTVHIAPLERTFVFALPETAVQVSRRV